MRIERKQVVRTLEMISPEEYGEQIAKEIIDWYLDDNNVDNVEWEHDEEKELTAIEIIRTLVDSMGLGHKFKFIK